MRSANRKDRAVHVTKGDVFDDLGFSTSETMEAKIKAEIWQALLKHIEPESYTQAQLATLLRAHQPDVSNLLKGKISKFQHYEAHSVCGARRA